MEASSAPSAAVDPPPVSFATTLFSHFPHLKNKNALSRTILDELIRTIKGRITLEKEYSKGLAKLSNPLSSTTPSLNEAIVGFSTDILNKANQHRELSENLKKDVLEELLSLRDRVHNAGKVAAGNCSSVVAKLKAAEKLYRASHRSYDRAWHEAKMHCCSSNLTMDEATKVNMEEMLKTRVKQAEIDRIQAMDDPEFEANQVRAATVKSFGLSSPMKDLSNWLLPTNESRRSTTIELAVENLLVAEQARAKCLLDWQSLNKINLKCAIEVQQTLNVLQSTEEKVIVEIQDMLRKHIVLESSCFANLQYDIQMLFGVMESVSVESDLSSFVTNVLKQHSHTKTKQKEEDKEKIEVEKSDLEEVVGNDITLHSDIIVNALEEEYEVDRRYVSLFECVNRDLPYPPNDKMVEPPVESTASLQENIEGYYEFWNWEKRTLERMGDIRIVADKSRSEHAHAPEEESSSSLIFADTIDEVIASVLTTVEEEEIQEAEQNEEYLRNMRSEIKASIVTGAEVDPSAKTLPMKEEPSALPTPPPQPVVDDDFDEAPQFITGVEENVLFPSPSTPNRKKTGERGVVNPRRQFPSITALQSGSQTMLLSKLVLHLLPAFDPAAVGASQPSSAVSEVLNGKQPRGVVEARSFLDKISGAFTLANLPILLEADEMIGATTAFSGIIFEAGKKEDDEASQELLRDCVIVSCFLSTSTEGAIKFLKAEEAEEGGGGNGALLKYIEAEKGERRLAEDRFSLRQVLGMHPFWKSGKVPVGDILKSVVKGWEATIGGRDVKGLVPDHLAEGGVENDVVGQIAFLSWNFHQFGVPSGGIKRGVRESLCSGRDVFGGVDTLISTCLDLGSRVRGRSASSGYNSQGGMGSVGGGKQQWEVIKGGAGGDERGGAVAGEGAGKEGSNSVNDASSVNAQFEMEGGLDRLDEKGRSGSVVDAFQEQLEAMKLSNGGEEKLKF